MGKNLIYITLLLLLGAAVSCGNNQNKPTETQESTVPDKSIAAPAVTISKSIFPTGDKNFRQGDTINIGFESDKQIDSAFLYLNGVQNTLPPTDKQWIIETSGETPVGKTGFRIELFSYGHKESRSGSFTLLPAAAPKDYRAAIVRTYPHSRNAYTQGLEFYKGKLYESSGEYDKSYVHILNFPSMKAEREENLDARYFAEGLTFLNDQMYLLTWKENTCFILNPESLNELERKSYNTEGWGITTDEEVLYMSDGTHYISVLDPDTFSTIRTIQVYTPEGSIPYINELEWINGEIWANVYGFDIILRINPVTGAVNGIVHAPGLLERSDIRPETDVLNGIAYDKEHNKIYVTGKNWPKLFEIAISPAK